MWPRDLFPYGEGLRGDRLDGAAAAADADEAGERAEFGGDAGPGTASDLVVVARDDASGPRARELARSLGAALAPYGTGSVPAGQLKLLVSARGLSLAADGMELMPDFADLVPRLRGNRLSRELLVRAARVKPCRAGIGPLAVDATAGLGEDSLLLAAAGFEVLLCESDPVVCALLRDAVDRARQDPDLAGIADRLTVYGGDSVVALGALRDAVDLVYLDPMFPERRKSAAVKKKFQLIHRLEAPCANQEELLGAAWDARPRRIVVKRPVKGPYLAGRKPSCSLAGKAVRFDVLLPPAGSCAVSHARATGNRKNSGSR